MPLNHSPQLAHEDLAVEQLLRRQEEFMRLYAQHELMIRGLVVSMLPSWDDAAEVLQETSLVIWRKFGDFEPGTNFLRWACRVAELEVRRFRTMRHRDRLQFDESLLAQIAEARLTQSEDLADRHRALAACLAKLREQDRALLTERYIHNKQGQAIAADRRQPADSIYKALKRIRAVLYKCIHQTLAREGRQ